MGDVTLEASMSSPNSRSITLAEVFGVVPGALSVAALFNNCVACFEYIQLGRHFARDYERCQLKVDVARTRLSRWGHAVAINQDPRFATDNPDNESVQQVQDILIQIDQLFQYLENASQRYTRRAKKEDLEHLQIDAMPPVGQKLHNRLRAIIAQRQKGNSFFKKAAWALYDGKNFEKLVNEITAFVDALEKLFPGNEGVWHTLVEMEIEEVNDEPSLEALQSAAADTDSILAYVVTEKLEKIGGRNYVKEILSDEGARVWVGNEWADAVLSRSLGPLSQASNEVDSVTAKGSSAVHIRNSYGRRSIFDW
ncbi:heterokaryon incompatibility protein s [Nemania serpens]|nr:heterokaryon incompatibility protein s [Nemania serpens]